MGKEKLVDSYADPPPINIRHGSKWTIRGSPPNEECLLVTDFDALLINVERVGALDRHQN
jgi:hypothetical protein